MKLKSINIFNYKSIESLFIEIKTLTDNSNTYGFIGENEAGKSSILKAIALCNSSNGIKVNPNDFRDKTRPIIVDFIYDIDREESEALIPLIGKTGNEEKIDEIKTIKIDYQINIETLNKLTESLIFFNRKKTSLILLNPNTEITLFIHNLKHKTIFWSFDDRYLISKEINLPNFLNNPEATSIPLKNCFRLAGYTDDLNSILPLLNDSTEREEIRDKLSDAVTNHLKSIWKRHNVKITFDLTPTSLNFHIKDVGIKNKAKTIEQRSDGFKQFISFLLTISAENKNSDLKNTILLLDEPETHLHPKAQEDLLIELVEITKRNNNILLFATHSNYLIDKNLIERNAKTIKLNDKTIIEWFLNQKATYSSVNYDVFGIASSDFHNEMYDLLREQFAEVNNIIDLGINKFDEEFFKQEKKLKKDKKNKGKVNSVTLPTYIRNCIHYPSNKTSDFEKLLIDSIELLKKYLKE